MTRLATVMLRCPPIVLCANLAANCFLLTLTTSTVFARVLIRRAESDHYPRYAFKYSVHDHKTNDHKEHWETRNGDLVKGAYSLVEPDGKLRLVDYWADDARGFNADVKRLDPEVHPPAIRPAPVEEHSDDAPPKPVTTPPVPLAPITVSPASNGVTDEALKPLILPVNYGFGSGEDAPLGRPYANVASGSLRWDPKTSSYGGWVPLNPKEVKYATIFSKKYIDGKLHEWAIGPISLVGRTLVFKVKHH